MCCAYSTGPGDGQGFPGLPVAPAPKEGNHEWVLTSLSKDMGATWPRAPTL